MLKPRRRNTAKNQVGRGASIPAPVGGWDAVSSIADMGQDRAVVLENWMPRPGYVEVRRGHKVHASGMGSGVVDSLLVYNGLTSAASKMFAATANTIYDVSSSGAATSAVTSLSNNRWQGVNFTTSGGKFLWICNGADDPRHYNGSAWATPSLTGITGSDAIHVNAHKNRLWVVLKDSTKAAYLATGAVAGAFTTFELGGQFTKGGYLVAMATRYPPLVNCPPNSNVVNAPATAPVARYAAFVESFKTTQSRFLCALTWIASDPVMPVRDGVAHADPL